jgi:uncharacterized protein (TIGR00297 family)
MEGFLYGVGLAGLVILLALRYGWLTIPAAIGAFILGSLVFGFCGIKWSVPLLVFFFSSVLMTRYGRDAKRKFKDITDIEPKRRLHQVVANGGVAGIMILLSVFSPNDQWYIIYGAVIASMTSDTWSTEIGMLSPGTPRHIHNGRKVTHGTSGGLTLAGVAAGIGGSVCILLSMTPWLGFQVRPIIIICFTGLLSNLFDSLLGATLQVRFRCSRCDTLTERTSHCAAPAIYDSGIHILTNDGVNFGASVFSALTAYVLIVVFSPVQ